MMKTLLDIVNRDPTPKPWAEGDNIPWNDPDFSERMLAEHLSQEHDLASRKSETIDNHVKWIFSSVLDSKPVRVLDLACGPGLYTNRLAELGCECVGLDFSPASIQHASRIAADQKLSCSFHQADLRDGQFGEGFDLVMLIYGQLNVFPRNRAVEILSNAFRALKPGGSLLVEYQGRDQIQRGGEAGASWYSAPSGLFSATPHLVLQENFWDEDARASTTRFLHIDAQTGSVNRYALSNEAYTDEELEETLRMVGFTEVETYPSLSGKVVNQDDDLPVVVARM